MTSETTTGPAEPQRGASGEVRVTYVTRSLGTASMAGGGGGGANCSNSELYSDSFTLECRLLPSNTALSTPPWTRLGIIPEIERSKILWVRLISQWRDGTGGLNDGA